MEVEKHILKIVSEQVEKECSSCRVELQVHNKESINDIAIPDKVYADHWRGQTNLILKVGDKNRIVTVTVRWFDQVVVANTNIKQGQVIESSDLRVVDKDVTFLNVSYINDIEKAVGWEGRRIFQRGQIIDEGVLTKPLVVRYGQPLEILFEDGALRLSMRGKARGAGAIGDRIPVYMPKTGKKVFAKIINKTSVRIQ